MGHNCGRTCPAHVRYRSHEPGARQDTYMHGRFGHLPAYVNNTCMCTCMYVYMHMRMQPGALHLQCVARSGADHSTLRVSNLDHACLDRQRWAYKQGAGAHIRRSHRTPPTPPPTAAVAYHALAPRETPHPIPTAHHRCSPTRPLIASRAGRSPNHPPPRCLPRTS